MGITVSSFVEGSDLRVRMLSFVLLLPFSSAVSVVGKTDLIDGHFKYKAAPGDGIEDYYDRRWGIPSELVAQFKEEPYVEVWQLNESGSGFDNWNKDGDNATPKDAWTWHAPVKRRGLEGSWMMASASLIGPNTIQIIYLAEEQAITEIQTHKFTPAGIERTYVATAADDGMGERIVFKSFHERVDENGKPISLPPLKYAFLPYFGTPFGHFG